MSAAFLFKNEYMKALGQYKLDGRQQHLLHNIFKIDQKSLSKLFMTSQQIFICSKSTRETLKADRPCSNTFILTFEHNSHHFWVTIADIKQENIYLDSFFWLWNFTYLHTFFSNNKALLSSTRTSYIFV